MRTATLLLLVFFALLPFIKGEKDVIKTSVRSSKKTFQCTFTMILDGKVVDIEKSRLSCSPSKPKRRKLKNLKIDGKLGSYIVSITINPSKIKTAEFLAKPQPEAVDCDLGYTKVCLPNNMSSCDEGKYKYCPSASDDQILSLKPDCNCLPAFTVTQAVSSGVSPLGCDKACVCISEEFMQCDNGSWQDDLDAINTAINTLETDITGVWTNITALKDDLEAKNTATNTAITGVRTNITGMRTDITDVNTAINSLETDITGVRTDITALKDDLEEMNTAINTDINTAITDVRTDITGVRTDITALKGYINTCAYQHITNIKSQTITYDRLLLSSSNLGQLGGGLNTGTGLFTAPVTGDYMVTFGLKADNHAGDRGVAIYIMKNTVRIEESLSYSQYTGSSGFVDEQGGRSLILHLTKGETTSLYCRQCTAYVQYITFCVSLTTPTSG